MAHINEVVNPPDWLIGSIANLNGQAADPFKIPARYRVGTGGAVELMLDRLARIQLMIFAIVTVLMRRRDRDLLLARAGEASASARTTSPPTSTPAGGLYENANVTYRGVTVGRVEAVNLSNDGVVAHMQLNSDFKVPENVRAIVKSVSAVGEQYVDLVPPKDGASKSVLGNGYAIPKDRTEIGQDIEGLLNQAQSLVSSISNTRLKELLSETFKAFNGSGPELARLIQSGRSLVDEANANWPETEQLLDQIGPFLQSQIQSGDDIRSLSNGLARFTTQLRQCGSAVALAVGNGAERGRRSEHHVQRNPADVPGAGRQSG